MRLRCPSASVAAFAIAAALVPGVIAAQEGTPEADQRVPQPEECRVEPRPTDELVELLGPAGTPTARQTGPGTAAEPLPIPLGEPVDPETDEALTAAARELLACLNAGDIRRTTALFTDAAVGPAFGPAPADPSGLEREPTPLDPEARTRLIAITDPSLLEDGRAAAFLVINDPLNPPRGPETLLLIFAQEDDRWLVDGLIDFTVVPETPEGTPTADATPQP